MSEAQSLFAVLQQSADADSVAACDEHGMAMVCTGVRHFRH